MATPKKDPFEFTLLGGLFPLKTKINEMTFAQLMIFIVIVLAVLLAVVMVLKWYAAPLGITTFWKKISTKIFKSRSP